MLTRRSLRRYVAVIRTSARGSPVTLDLRGAPGIARRTQTLTDAPGVVPRFLPAVSSTLVADPDPSVNRQSARDRSGRTAWRSCSATHDLEADHGEEDAERDAKPEQDHAHVRRPSA